MLLQADIDLCKTAFHKIDSEKKGYLEPVELCHLYAELGVSGMTEMDILDMMRNANIPEDVAISFENFVDIVEVNGQAVKSKEDSEADTLLAFVSMGGNIEGEGKVDVARLKKTCQDFGLTIDIDNLIKDVDVDKDGHVGFSEFKTILTSPTKKPFRSADGDVPPEHSLLSALRKGRGGSFMPGLHTADEADYDSDGP